jgi:hypothetical protein
VREALVAREALAAQAVREESAQPMQDPAMAEAEAAALGEPETAALAEPETAALADPANSMNVRYVVEWALRMLATTHAANDGAHVAHCSAAFLLGDP